ncbi:MAG: helix-turn-helix domain-containing protein [Proteobacteria bacterium]|nr:MAG: helix-turn-helix domain-containing protein [Pseudomonadota bacterium]
MTDNNHNELTIEQLSARRDKQGITVAEMANLIKVSREIINYIEQGEFNRIGSPTFIRGHVGNYAKELGLDPQTIIDLIPKQHLKPHELKLSSSKVSNPLSRVKTHSSGFGRYVLGTFLVAALGLSFYFVYDKWDSDQSDQPILTVQNNDSLPLSESNKPKKVIYSSLLPQAELAEQRSTDDDNSQPVYEETNPEIMAEDFDGEQTADSTETISNDVTGNADNNSQQQQLDQELQAVTENPLYAIRFNLSEQAWVSIKTQSGAMVVSDLIGPGERYYSVNEPVHFRIGNAGQLSLHINDKAIDLRQNTRQNVADFDWPPPQG